MEFDSFDETLYIFTKDTKIDISHSFGIPYTSQYIKRILNISIVCNFSFYNDNNICNII